MADAKESIYEIFTEGTIMKNPFPNTITFNTSSTWAIRIRERKIEVNPEVEVTEAAQAVFDVLEPMLNKQWLDLTHGEIHSLGWMDEMSFEDEVELVREVEAKLKEKNRSGFKK
jgi:hypothetical protein